MSIQDVDMLLKHGIKMAHIAKKMGVSESLLRYHLAHELRHPETSEKFRGAVVETAQDILSDMAPFIKSKKKKRK